MTQNLIFCGSQRSDRKNKIQKILQDNYTSTLLIVPTRQYAQKRRIELLNSITIPAIEKNIITDFIQFTNNLLKGQCIPLHLLEEWEQTLLIRSIILSEEGRKKFESYKGLLAPENLADSFHRIIRNLKQAGITPETFQEQIKKTFGRTLGRSSVVGIYYLSGEVTAKQLVRYSGLILAGRIRMPKRQTSIY